MSTAVNEQARRPPVVMLVVGTRPEAIKMAPVALAMRERASGLEPLLCATGQHDSMLRQALADFSLEPDVDLHLMRSRQTLASLSARILRAMDKVLSERSPDLVLVQGDTSSAMVGALTAFYRRIPVAHLEAGLRTGDLGQPFPEEGNRRLLTALASVHFAPTDSAARQLHREGVPTRQVHITGNTVIDALLHIQRTSIAPRQTVSHKRILLTMHRRESFGVAMENICGAVRQVVDRNRDVEVIFPVHPSPFVRDSVQRLLGGQRRIHLTEPMGYREFVALLESAYLVMTDSGGIQEEAPALGKPVLVLREKTERPEAVDGGSSRLVGTESSRILFETEELLHNPAAYSAMARATNAYGDGRAAERVVAAVRYFLGLTSGPPAPFRWEGAGDPTETTSDVVESVGAM